MICIIWYNSEKDAVDIQAVGLSRLKSSQNHKRKYNSILFLCFIIELSDKKINLFERSGMIICKENTWQQWKLNYRMVYKKKIIIKWVERKNLKINLAHLKSVEKPKSLRTPPLLILAIYRHS